MIWYWNRRWIGRTGRHKKIVLAAVRLETSQIQGQTTFFLTFLSRRKDKLGDEGFFNNEGKVVLLGAWRSAPLSSVLWNITSIWKFFRSQYFPSTQGTSRSAKWNLILRRTWGSARACPGGQAKTAARDDQDNEENPRRSRYKSRQGRHGASAMSWIFYKRR